ncbi:MAG: amidohydrolase [Nocardioidaceae bacterium]
MSDQLDLVFAGGAVFCPDGRFATVVGVRAGRIVAVGGDQVRDLAGPASEQVDLAGGLLVPGFQDAHVHPVQGGLERMRCDLTGEFARDAYLARIREYADTHPELEWITGGGWSMAPFPGGTPTAADLDTVVSDRPVFLPNRDHHGAWVNTRALDLAGLDATTPDPPDGRVERDESGAPSGTLHEGAMDIVGRLVPADTDEDRRSALLEAQTFLHSLGITAWQDAIIGSYANIEDAAGAYLSLESEGKLTAKVVGALWWQRDRGAEQIPELIERREALTSTRFRATSVKIMQDGVAENFTAGMIEPYLDGHGARTSNRGISFVDPAQLLAHVTSLDAAGFQVHIHAIGDRAIREALDAFAAARHSNGANDHRHHLAHIQVIQPADIGRFAALGVTANMQPLWAANEPQMVDLTIPFLGAQRAGWQYPFASLAASGARLAGGSDWPVSSPNPLWGVHVAVNRQLPVGEGGEGYEPLLPHESLDLRTALTAYTAGSAFVNHLDDTGSIAEGKVADLVVLDRNPFIGPAEAIAETRVLATYVEGQPVYTA